MHIVVLVHRHHHLDPWEYFMTEIAGVWREEHGITVTVCRGTDTHVEADLAVMHVDLTVVPPEYVAFAARYPKSINGRVVDITKRRISQCLLKRDDGYDGPVIVKSNFNFGGYREYQLSQVGLHRRVMAFRPGDYQVFTSAREVPPGVWHHPDLVVEKFLSERREGMYCLRTWVFLGDRETNSLSYSKSPVVKSATVVRRDVVPEVPDELRRMRRELGFDYGKFDYAIVDGKVILYDPNRTPGLGNFNREQFMPRIRHLAEGIGAFQ